MGIAGIASTGKGKSSAPVTDNEDYRTQRPKTQQKSSVNQEQEKEEELAQEIIHRVHREQNLEYKKDLTKITQANKKFTSVLQVHRVEFYYDEKKDVERERYVPQSRLVFTDDDEFYKWAMAGGFDKDLNDDFDYVVLRKIQTNKEI